MRSGAWLAIGIGVGTAIGVAMDHLAMCVALGAAFGVALEAFNNKR
jgi:hypothetical protein